MRRVLKILGSLAGLVLVGLAALSLALAPSPPTGAPPTDLELPPTRNYRLSLAYQPPDWSPRAFADTFAFIGEHADMIAHFADDGVPWEAASQGGPYAKEIEEDIERRARNRRDGQRILLAVNPVSPARNRLARLLGPTGAVDLPPRWKEKGWDDPELSEAYLNWVRHLVRRLEPHVLGYAFEVNSTFHESPPEEFRAFLGFLGTVRAALKREFPDLPLLIEVVLGDDEYMAPRWEVTEALVPLADIVGISTYPYVYDSVVANESRVPEDWFRRLKDRVGDRKLAISETGFLGADLTHPEKGMWIPGRGRVLVLGDEATQAAYVRFMLAEAQALDLEFVNWWVWRDLDRLWEKIGGHGDFADPMWGMWNHAGLQDAEGRPRTGQRIWDAWRALPVGK